MVMRIFFVFSLCLLATSVHADDDRFKAVTTFTVIADMARNVAGDAAIVESITRPGAEIHNYSPTPRDLLRAQGADLVLWNGLDLELWFTPFFNNLSNVPSAILTEGIQPLSITEGEYNGKTNPHAWMSLSNALVYVDNIRDAFITYDPENAEAYEANAQNYKQKIIDTIAPLRNALASVPESQRWLVTCEGAFSYLAADFGLRELYLWPINADEVGSPQQVRKVIDGIREHNIPVIFCESTVSSAPAEQVARETEAIFGGILYVDSLTTADGPVPTYIDLLRVTSETIVKGLTQ